MSSHGISVARFGQLIAINGVLIVILQPLVLRYVSRVRRRSVLALGALLNGIGFGLPALGHTQWLYAASIVLWTLGEILLSPVVLTLIADLAPPRLRGSYQGGYQLSWGTASLLGPSLGGLIMGRLGAPVLWLICLLVGGLGALLHLLTAPARRRRLTTLPDAESLLLREDGR
jgi:MFS family permease